MYHEELFRTKPGVKSTQVRSVRLKGKTKITHTCIKTIKSSALIAVWSKTMPRTDRLSPLPRFEITTGSCEKDVTSSDVRWFPLNTLVVCACLFSCIFSLHIGNMIKQSE